MNLSRAVKAWSFCLVGALFFVLVSPAAVLNVPQCYQEKDQWCWNASAQMVLKYKGYNYSQSAIAKWAVAGKNVANYIYGSDSTRKGVDLILKHFGNISSSGSAAALTSSALNSETAASRPVVIRWGWDSGGGHILVIRGVSGNAVYLNDPWPANGPSVNSYNWVKRGGGHTWTHSLKLKPTNSAYYTQYQRNYNLAMQYYNATWPYYNQAYAYGNYGYLGYAYYFYAHAHYYYGLARYYYWMYKTGNANEALSNQHKYWTDAYYYLAEAYKYYYYYFLGYYYPARSLWYENMGYAYRSLALQGYYYYRYYGMTSSANAWYNKWYAYYRWYLRQR